MNHGIPTIEIASLNVSINIRECLEKVINIKTQIIILIIITIKTLQSIAQIRVLDLFVVPIDHLPENSGIRLHGFH
jgi:hypothetical protein